MGSTKEMKKRILVVAAEASSGLYLQRLMEHWKQTDQQIEAFGVGPKNLKDYGFDHVATAEDMAVVGIVEVAKHFRKIRSCYYEILEKAKKEKPAVALLMDYPGFNLRLAKDLKKLGIPVVYYISPQVWAWKTSRVHEIKKVVDRMLVILPFEEDFYKAYEVSSEFVGHPLLDELKHHELSAEEVRELRGRFGVKPDDIVIGLMPGSRHSEINHHLEVQLEAAKILLRKNNGEDSKVKIALLVAPSFEKEYFQSKLGVYDESIILMKDDPFRMIQMVDYMITASGTATLMVGLMKKPMVVMYRMNPVTAWLAKMLVKSAKHFGLINLVCGERVVPELFQEQASPQSIANEIQKMIDDPAYKNQIVSKLEHARAHLKKSGATARVAEVLKEFF